ncbi:glycosyltransferase [Chryseobacterium sp.]|jgi:glycosyltransferase involved in cell wall biosynthesis|uniref:glycosyltransferase n=1 Tax=Chryseobacterium sp. TaxID=1871047 RepID=UPI00283C7042|nr:glycosyltransferase [Chryseobacterium sp.]MDR3026716.1 glycosyltransferase [Chryseobacterium sp.]
MPKVLFLTTSHSYNDDRIFYHQAKALRDNGYEVKICSLYADYKEVIDGIEIESYAILEESIEKKMETFRKVCDNFQPQTIICSEPLAVVASKKFVKEHNVSCIYDVTEWYPSMRMLSGYSSYLLKFVHAIKFLMIQLYAGYISTHFIFGEKTKKFPLASFFPFKKRIVLPYFPDNSYIYPHIKNLNPEKITICYTGQLSKEKGIENFFRAADTVRMKKPGLDIEILLVGAARTKKDEIYFSELLKKYAWKNIKIVNTVLFEDFTQSYADADLCFDLRDLNFENDHCLPIKIFYYAASGKPVIYTNLKAIRKFMDVSPFGFLVNPTDAETIADIILNYIHNPEIYKLHAHNARKEYEEKYTWDSIKGSFTDFVKQAMERPKR